MMNKDKILSEIFDDDPLGILNVKARVSNKVTSDERLESSFEELNKFIDENKREPEPNIANISEYKLYSTLKGLRENHEKIEALSSLDRHNLLIREEKQFDSIDDILGDDSLDILRDDSEDIFNFKHTPKDFERAKADFVGRRTKCKDFDKYEHLFKEVQNDLSLGKRKLVKFKLSTLREGSYYVHNGQLFLIEKIDYQREESVKDSHIDGRTRCIFENGTESNILLRTVEKNLYNNGKAVTENISKVLDEFNEQFSGVSEEDKESGYIYALKSKSKKEEISSIENLYKIGFCSTTVEERIKNAEKQPTYLMAPVQIVASWKCYNMNAKKFEQLIQRFFGESCLEIDVFDENDKRHSPREWFIAPLEEIENAISLIITGKIVDYKYDIKYQKIVRR